MKDDYIDYEISILTFYHDISIAQETKNFPFQYFILGFNLINWFNIINMHSTKGVLFF